MRRTDDTMKYKTVIFDMDGTLLDSLSDIYDCVELYLKKFGYPPRSIDEVKRAMGGGAANLVRSMLPEDLSQHEYEAFFKEYIPYYEAHGKDKTAAYPGIIELLNDLKAGGAKLAVVSSKPQKAALALCEHYFNGLFDEVIGDSFDLKLKPAPDMLLLALQRLGVRKETAIYIGDSEYDILTAKNAAIDGVAVSWGYRNRDELKALGPMYLADDVCELREILL